MNALLWIVQTGPKCRPVGRYFVGDLRAQSLRLYGSGRCERVSVRAGEQASDEKEG